MKQIAFLFLVVVSFCFSAKAQIQRPFPDSSAFWVWEHTMFNSSGTGLQRTYYTYYISGDTTLNNLVYHKLFVKYYDLNFSSLVGAYRKDSLKVYYVDFSYFGGLEYGMDCDSSECLLYDFGMQVGDSIFQVTLDSVDHYLTVTEIDTISVNGENLKRWHLSSRIDPNTNWFDMVWIEGVGSLLPFFNYYPVFESGTQLLCFYMGSVFFQVTSLSFSDCLQLGTEEFKSFNKIELFPNPANNEVNIRFFSSYSGEKEIMLYDNLGRLLNSLNSDKSEVKIDLSGNQNGFYFLKVITSEQSEVFKFIVGK